MEAKRDASKLISHPASKDSFNTVNKDFSVDYEDSPDLNHDPIEPGRRRILLLACICILGEHGGGVEGSRKAIRSRVHPLQARRLLNHKTNRLLCVSGCISAVLVPQAMSCAKGNDPDQLVCSLSSAAFNALKARNFCSCCCRLAYYGLQTNMGKLEGGVEAGRQAGEGGRQARHLKHWW